MAFSFSSLFNRGRISNDAAAEAVIRRQTSSVAWVPGGSEFAPELSPEKALEISGVYACAKIIAEDIARMPINVVKRTYDGKGRELRAIQHDNPLHVLLSRRPNAWQTPVEFITTIMTQLILTGQALAVKGFNGKGELVALWPMPAGSWEVTQVGTTRLRFEVNGTPRTQDQVVYFRSVLSLDGFTSFNPVLMARQAFGIASGLERIQIGLTNNSGRPSGILTFDELTGNDEGDAKIKEEWDKTYGPRGKGGVGILSATNAKYYPLTMSLTDAQFIESRRFQIEEIARFFRVAPEKLIPGTKTYASATVTAQAHYKETLMPWVRLLEQAFARDLLAYSPDLIIDFDEKELLRGSNAETAEYLMKLIGSSGQQGVISVNEARYELGLDPLDGDQFELPQINRGEDQPAPQKEQE